MDSKALEREFLKLYKVNGTWFGESWSLLEQLRQLLARESRDLNVKFLEAEL